MVPGEIGRLEGHSCGRVVPFSCENQEGKNSSSTGRVRILSEHGAAWGTPAFDAFPRVEASALEL